MAAVSASDVWAVGFTVQTPAEDAPTLTSIEHWNGKSWQIVESPSPQPGGDNALFGVAAVSANDVWAVGFSSPIPGAHGFGGGSGQTLIEHWDGNAWSVVTSPNPPGSVNSILNTVAVVEANDIWTAGFFRNTADPSGPHSTLIEHWDGKSWQVVQSPTPESFGNLTRLAVVSARDIWAVGLSSNMPNGGPIHTLTEHWNGSRWQIVASPNPGWFASSLVAVAVISARNVWAVGAYTNNTFVTGQSQTLVEHWNGQAWQVVPSQAPGILDNGLSAVVRVPGTKTLWAVGQEGDASVLRPTSEFSC